MLASRAAVALALLSGEHSAISPAPTSVTVSVVVCATPCAAISTAVVHDSSTAKVIQASSSSVVFLIPLPFHKGGGTRQPRLNLYNVTTLASGGELAMNFVSSRTLFLAKFAEFPVHALE
jgi:hypothetical protein